MVILFLLYLESQATPFNLISPLYNTRAKRDYNQVTLRFWRGKKIDNVGHNGADRNGLTSELEDVLAHCTEDTSASSEGLFSDNAS